MAATESTVERSLMRKLTPLTLFQRKRRRYRELRVEEVIARSCLSLSGQVPRRVAPPSSDIKNMVMFMGSGKKRNSQGPASVKGDALLANLLNQLPVRKSSVSLCECVMNLSSPALQDEPQPPPKKLKSTRHVWRESVCVSCH